MDKSKLHSLSVTTSICIVVLLLCLIPVGFVGNRIIMRIRIETEAKDRLETALKTRPVIPGEVLVQAAAGKDFGGTMGCVSYSIEQVRATNDVSLPEVLSLYSTMLPSTGWTPDLVTEKALTFDHVGDVHLAVAEIQEVYWYYLYPFNDPFNSRASNPDKGIIEQAKRQFKTVFTLTIGTYPPDNEKCRER